MIVNIQKGNLESEVAAEVKREMAQTGKPRPADSSPEENKIWLIVETQLAEFTKLRDEINLYHDHQKEEIYFAMLGFGGLMAILLAPSNMVEKYTGVFLLFPLLFTSLAAAYADRTIRILRIATYIHNHLRENLVHELGTSKILQWEVFKKHRVHHRKEEMKRTESARWFRTFILIRHRIPELPKLLDISRSLQFVIPSIIAIGLFIYFHSSRGFGWLSRVGIVVSLIIALLPLYLSVKTEETSGIDLRPQHRALEDWERLQRKEPKVSQVRYTGFHNIMIPDP